MATSPDVVPSRQRAGRIRAAVITALDVVALDLLTLGIPSRHE